MARAQTKKKAAQGSKERDGTNWSNELFKVETDISLSIFRICFGIIILISTVKLWNNLSLNYIDQFFAYKYQGFEWVQLANERILKLILGAMFVASLLVILGVLIRLGSFVFLLGYTYFFLLDASYYNNHYYVIILLTFLFFVTNGGQSFSLHTLIFRSPFLKQSEKWKTLIFQVQIFIIYFFGGLAKLNFDWLSGGTMDCILSSGADFHEKGSFFQSDFAVYFYTWAGLLFDLFVGFLLLKRRFRFFAVFAILAFNIMNAIYFKLGVFPFMMIAATLLFFDREDFNRLLKYNYNKFTLVATVKKRERRMVYAFLSIYLMIQVVVPMRHHFIKGNVDWTGEGKKFAWRMKQPCKIPEEFTFNFGHPDPSVDLGFDFQLNKSQMNELLYYPEHVLQVRDFLLSRVDPEIRDEIIFYPKISSSMNGRRAKRLYDIKRYNLLEVEDKFFQHNNWITDID